MIIHARMRVAAVVLAAGEGRRMGGPKALARLRGSTFVAAVAGGFDRADVFARIVVLGASADPSKFGNQAVRAFKQVFPQK